MKRTNRAVRILSVLCGISVAVMVLALCFGQPEPKFTPPPFEMDAQSGAPDVPGTLGYQVLDAQVFRVGVCGKVIPDGKGADVWLTNPEGNAVWLKLRVMDGEGNVLGQTGILRPGEYVRQVMLSPMPQPGSVLVLKVMAYEPETYYAAGALTLHTVTAGE